MGKVVTVVRLGFGSLSQCEAWVVGGSHEPKLAMDFGQRPQNMQQEDLFYKYSPPMCSVPSTALGTKDSA